jgi:HK97 gp10 family phage protein
MAKFVGFSELKYVLDQMRIEFGVQDSRKNVLIPAAKNAMKIVLQAAKNNLVPGHGLDTGQLKKTLRVSARAVTGKDLRSGYVKPGDVVISTVSAKLVKNYVPSATGKGGIKNIGDVSDARAIAVEFGTKNKNKNVDVKGLSKRSALALQRELGTVRMEARPYLRPALEKNYNQVSKRLSEEIVLVLAKYKAKNQVSSS